MCQLIKTISFLTSALAAFLFGKAKGKESEKQEQTKVDYANLQRDIKLNKEVASLDFSDKSNFLLSKQKNRRRK